MHQPRRCTKLISGQEIKQSTTGVGLPRVSTPESRLYLACAQAASISATDFPDEIESLLQRLADTMDEVREAHERSDAEAEREYVREGMHLYSQALGKMAELGLEEPQVLRAIFELVTDFRHRRTLVR